MSSLIISPGQTSSGSIGANTSWFVEPGGTTSNVAISGGGFEVVSAGGHAFATTVNQSGTLSLHGGAASGTKVGSGGYEYVSALGSASATTISNGGFEYVSNGTAGGAVISGGGEQVVWNGGSAFNTTANGFQFVEAGGIATGTVVQSNGIQIISAGTAISTTIGVGSQFVDSGGTASATKILKGGFEFVINGTASGTVISSGGAQYLTSSAGSGVAIATSVLNGGNEVVSLGGKASGTTVSSGGFEIVSSGGSAFGTIVSAFGTEMVFGGAIVSKTLLTLNGGIDVRQLVFSSGVLGQVDGTGLLTVNEGGSSYSQQLSLQDAGLTFSATADGQAGTYVTMEGSPPCYCAGTRVLTDRGEIAVENLVIGDLIMTASGDLEPLRWIGRRSYDGRFAATNPDAWPVRIRRGALGENVPTRDLYVSPQHALYLDHVLIPAICLVNGASIVKVDRVEAVHYFHLELASHGVILAEGAAAETFVDDNSRMLFQNFAEFAALYPEATPSPALFCAPRVTSGFALESVRLQLGIRAGLRSSPPPRQLRGYVDRAEGHVIEGWAQNPDQPERPVCLDIVVDGVVIAQTMASRFRADLAAAGLGSGRHGFRLRLSEPLTRRETASLVVRRSLDRRPLTPANVARLRLASG